MLSTHGSAHRHRRPLEWELPRAIDRAPVWPSRPPSSFARRESRRIRQARKELLRGGVRWRERGVAFLGIFSFKSHSSAVGFPRNPEVVFLLTPCLHLWHSAP